MDQGRHDFGGRWKGFGIMIRDCDLIGEAAGCKGLLMLLQILK